MNPFCFLSAPSNAWPRKIVAKMPRESLTGHLFKTQATSPSTKCSCGWCCCRANLYQRYGTKIEVAMMANDLISISTRFRRFSAVIDTKRAVTRRFRKCEAFCTSYGVSRRNGKRSMMFLILCTQESTLQPHKQQQPA